MLEAGWIECPHCQGEGTSEVKGHACGSWEDCERNCPQWVQVCCKHCHGDGCLEILEVLANG